MANRCQDSPGVLANSPSGDFWLVGLFHPLVGLGEQHLAELVGRRRRERELDLYELLQVELSVRSPRCVAVPRLLGIRVLQAGVRRDRGHIRQNHDHDVRMRQQLRRYLAHLDRPLRLAALEVVDEDHRSSRRPPAARGLSNDAPELVPDVVHRPLGRLAPRIADIVDDCTCDAKDVPVENVGDCQDDGNRREGRPGSAVQIAQLLRRRAAEEISNALDERDDENDRDQQRGCCQQPALPARSWS